MNAPTTRTHRLRFPELGREIDANSDETIFHAARRNGLRIVGACGGRGTCGTCVVRVTEGRIDHVHSAPPERLETNVPTSDTGAPHGRRKWLRACQLRVRSDCVVEVAPRSLAPVVRADIDMADSGIDDALDPAVSVCDLSLPAATLADPLSDADRVARALRLPAVAIDLGAARALPGALRDSEENDTWTVRVHLRGNEVIRFSAPGSRTLGLAVDLGTTNVAAFLLDLETGQRIAGLGIENPQTAWGADLISRINHAIRSPQALGELRTAAVAAINGLAHDLCRDLGAGTQDIVDAAICGNTAMHHLLLGLPVRQLGRAPFVAASLKAMDLKARDLGLAFCPGAGVHLAPSVGGFVGGDHVTALLATEERWRTGGTSLVMDIGTNTEISLIHQGRIVSASCPSGPALEGGHISCGMRAADGAIERVGVNGRRLSIRTIGGEDAVGLCGSGVLDTLSAMRRLDILSARGRIAEGYEDVVDHEGVRAVRLAPGVHFSQHDVRAVQLAKAAIRAGTEMLLREQGITEQQIQRFIVAGAFGAYIDIASGIDIGLFPDLPVTRFEQVGNAAGLGVRRLLTSLAARRRATEIAAACKYIELSTRSDFQQCFLHHIAFPDPIPRRPA
jgi:uncharacterized 2Fe-2S/4Fe-4S cluster protein (DUF4445 family)